MIARKDKSAMLINGTIAVIVTSVFVLWAMSLSDLDHIAAGLAHSPVSGWILCCVMMAAVTFARYLRIQFCVPGAPRLSLYRASALHGAAISVLPGKVGEAVLPLALKQLAGIPFLSGTGLLLLIRAFDMAALITLAVLSYSLSGVVDPAFKNLVMIAMPISLVLLMIAPLVVVHGLKFLPTSDHFIGRMIGSVTAALTIIPLSRIYLILFMTVIVWVLLGVATFVSIDAVGLEPTPINAMLAVALASFAFALPVNGIASIGPFEAAFAFGLGLFGFPLNASIAAAAHLHISAVGVAMIAALLGQVMVMATTIASRDALEPSK